ncbi:general odorant-binding protein 56d [Drosophila grimshawi]|uniref:GH22760 n=1 Tax=Drosophila grimshawi TaxID=7222 RepID=B4JWD2_DROGR|nr:general odorant-binding protein 56d [Drosophila grimshawi]EDV98270.1 GH22760 [Drosophila grimshawi]
MKFLIVLVACVALVAAEKLMLTEEQKQQAKVFAVACGEQEGISKEQAIALRDGKFENVDEKVKCFANCFLEKAGFIVNGQIKPDVVLTKLTILDGLEKVKAVQAKCDSLKGENNCDTAFKLYECYHQNHADI